MELTLVPTVSASEALANRLASPPATADEECTHILLRGYCTRANDPMWRESQAQSSVQKLVAVEGLAATMLRWSTFGRIIVGSSPMNWGV
jgi:hypothetical protein